MTEERRQIFQKIIYVVNHEQGGMFFYMAIEEQEKHLCG